MARHLTRRLRNLFQSSFLTIFTSQLITDLLPLKQLEQQQSQQSLWCNTQYLSFAIPKYFFYTLQLTYMFRGLILGYSLKLGDTPADHQSCDPVLTTALLNYRFINSTTIMLISLLWLFSIYLEYDYFIGSDYRLVKLEHELIIENGKDLVELNSKKLKPKVLKKQLWKPLMSIREKMTQLCTIWSCRNLKFKHSKLASLPKLSTKLRAKTVVISILLEGSFAVINVILAFGTLLLFISYLYMLTTEVPPLAFALAILDFGLTCYGTWSAIRIALAAIHFIILLAYISNGHMKVLNRVLSLAKKRPQLRAVLKVYYADYFALRRIAGHFNTRFSSTLLAVSFISNILLNIFIIAMLVFEPSLTTNEHILMVCIASIQIFLSMLGTQAGIYWSECFYRNAESNLFRAQLQLTTSTRRPSRCSIPLFQWSSTKLKLNTFYEAVCTRKKFRFTCGPVSKLSQKAIVKFLIAYSGYFMYISKTILKEKHSTSWKNLNYH